MNTKLNKTYGVITNGTHFGFDPEIIKGDCPLCGCHLTTLIEDSNEIRECDRCGTEWEQSSGVITLDPREL